MKTDKILSEILKSLEALQGKDHDKLLVDAPTITDPELTEEQARAVILNFVEDVVVALAMTLGEG